MENSERNPLPQLKSKRAETSVCCCQRTLWPPLLHALHLPGTEKPIKILAGLLPRPGTTTSFSTFKYYFVWSRATVKYNRNKMSFKVQSILFIIANVLATALQVQKSDFTQRTGTIGLIFFPPIAQRKWDRNVLLS